VLVAVTASYFERVNIFSLMGQALTEEDLRRLALLAAPQNFTGSDLESVRNLRHGIGEISVTIRKEMQEGGVRMIAVEDGSEILLHESGDSLLN
jgi:hypothetical protein